MVELPVHMLSLVHMTKRKSSHDLSAAEKRKLQAPHGLPACPTKQQRIQFLMAPRITLSKHGMHQQTIQIIGRISQVAPVWWSLYVLVSQQ